MWLIEISIEWRKIKGSIIRYSNVQTYSRYFVYGYRTLTFLVSLSSAQLDFWNDRTLRMFWTKWSYRTLIFLLSLSSAQQDLWNERTLRLPLNKTKLSNYLGATWRVLCANRNNLQKKFSVTKKKWRPESICFYSRFDLESNL